MLQDVLARSSKWMILEIELKKCIATVCSLLFLDKSNFLVGTGSLPSLIDAGVQKLRETNELALTKRVYADIAVVLESRKSYLVAAF